MIINNFTKKNKGKYNQKNRGFALMFAVLATSVLLSIAVAISNIAMREIALSTFGRESQVAFYAADSGIECALFWDFQDAGFSAPGQSGSTPVVNCAGQTPLISVPISSQTEILRTFDIDFGNSCTTISVDKTLNIQGKVVTIIQSRGHNASCTDGSKPTFVERALQVKYLE